MAANGVSLKIDELQDDIYGNFGSRLVALIIDGLILAPLGLLEYLINSLGKNYHIATTLLNFAVFIWYHIYLVKKNGATPGKTIAGLTIIKLNGEAIGWKEAFLRHSVSILFTLIYNIGIIYAITKADNDHYLALTWLKKSAYLISFYPVFFKVDSLLRNAWTWSELLVLLTNKRKRALHDFIAGTLVVNTKYLSATNEIVNSIE